MDKRLVTIFDGIYAEEDLKRNTVRFLYSEMTRRKRAVKYRFTVACACVLVFLVCGAALGRLYFAPVAYIDIDVNPSMELLINRFGRVIRSNAYNDDGMEVLNDVDVVHMSYNTALENLLAVMDARGYLRESATLYVTVQTDESSREEILLHDLQATIDAVSMNHHYELDSDLCSVTSEVKDSAAAFQVSPAKYLAVQDLLAVDPNSSFEECKEHSIHELRHLAQEKCSEHDGHVCNHEHSVTGHHNSYFSQSSQSML